MAGVKLKYTLKSKILPSPSHTMFDIDTSGECTETFWLWANLFHEKNV